MQMDMSVQWYTTQSVMCYSMRQAAQHAHRLWPTCTCALLCHKWPGVFVQYWQWLLHLLITLEILNAHMATKAMVVSILLHGLRSQSTLQPDTGYIQVSYSSLRYPMIVGTLL